MSKGKVHSAHTCSKSAMHSGPLSACREETAKGISASTVAKESVTPSLHSITRRARVPMDGKRSRMAMTALTSPPPRRSGCFSATPAERRLPAKKGVPRNAPTGNSGIQGAAALVHGPHHLQVGQYPFNKVKVDPPQNPAKRTP